MRQYRYLSIPTIIMAFFLTASLHARAPILINYQGKLTNNGGTPLEDGTYRMIFKIYNVPEGGTKFWEETHDTVRVTNGVFNVFLGGLEAFHDSVFNTTNPRYLGIAVGNDQEFKPRYWLTSVPFAIHSIHADSSIKSQSTVYADSSLKAYQSVKADTARWVLSATGVLDGHSLDAADGDPSDAVFVDNEGNVGIGTLTPTAKLEINGTAHIKGHSDSIGVYMDSLGNVGIGTLTPQYRLHINGSQSFLALTDGTSSPQGAIRGNQGTWLFGYNGTPGSEDISIGSTNPTSNARTVTIAAGGYSRIKVLANGNVGIGTTSPGYKFQVGNSGDGTEARANAWNLLSDARLKTNLKPIENALEKTLNLQGFYFTWKKVNKESIGLIAQDVEKIFPELVSTGSNDKYKSVNYDGIIPILIEAIKEQQQIIEAQHTKIEELQEKLNDMEAALQEIKSVLSIRKITPTNAKLTAESE